MNLLSKAYSYIRFSTPDQMKGDSFRRQYTMAQNYAAKTGLALDDSLSLNDVGVSAFRGQNAKTGALNFFLEHVKSGDVPKGSYLLIEALDRLSRQTPLDALDTLRDIMREGITVVTLDNETVYTTETINSNFTNLIVTLMLFSRANEESATKSRRLKQAWEGKRLKAAAKPLTAICPAWLRLSDDRTRYEIVTQRADVVRSVFSMCLEGLGQHAIAAKLNGQGINTFKGSEMWHRSYVKKLLDNSAVIGRFTPHKLDVIDGRKVRTPLEPVDGYYPAIVDVEVFEKVAAMSSRRGLNRTSVATGAERAVANVLSGLAKCPACGSTMTRINKGHKGGKPYLVCTKAKAGAGCQYRQVRLDLVENAILNVGSYLHGLTPSPNDELEREYREKLLQAEIVADQIQNLVEAISQGDKSKGVRDGLAAREDLLDQIRRELRDLGERTADSMTNRIDNAVEELRILTNGEATTLDLARINATLRQLFDKIVVDHDAGFLRMHWRHTAYSPVEVFYTFAHPDKVTVQKKQVEKFEAAS